ncbi:MAG: 1-(5-phosphoribosyl)-5-[(5-phosphoribosylamino)methylideneamino]imidazole-4-carboxamide isomerase [Nitrospirota bacterium]
MLIIPAVDIKNGQAVRLLQGDMNQATVYSKSPVEAARRWAAEGAKRIHIVDLNGAIGGDTIHFEVIKEIVMSVPAEIQVGGGIREISQIENYLAIGVKSVVLGTSVLNNRSFFEEAVRKFPSQIIAGIDCKNGLVAIQGWVNISDWNPIDLARRIEDIGPAAIIFTDISKDGMMQGPNLALYHEMTNAVQIPIIASGGITTRKDIQDLSEIPGIYGAIVGKALYSGNLVYQDVIRALVATATPNMTDPIGRGGQENDL